MKRLVGLTATLLAVSACGWTFTGKLGQPSPAPPPPPPPRTVTETAPRPPETFSEGPAIQQDAPECFAAYETEQSDVQLCSVSGQVYYYGTSSSGSIALPAHHAGAGTYQTESNEGYVYTISAEELVITSGGAVVSEQPVLSSTGG